MLWIGWLQVRQQGGQNNELKPEYLQELNDREMKAQTEGYGIWNKVSKLGTMVCNLVTVGYRHGL
jgi:hypothetical protein